MLLQLWLICFDDRYSKPYKTNFGEDAIDKFLNDMIKDNEYCSKTFKTKFNKSLVLTKKGHENFNNSIKCWIC